MLEWDQQGQATRASGVHQEINDRKKLESELKALSRKADAANDAKTRFLANMSHEIRTPLNVFTESGEVRVELGYEMAADSKVSVTLDVHDTGIGLTKGQLKRVMERFEQADSSITRRLREQGYKKKIVAFTANVMTEDLALYKEAGMDEFLSKPLRRAALVELLDRCLVATES